MKRKRKVLPLIRCDLEKIRWLSLSRFNFFDIIRTLAIVILGSGVLSIFAV